MAATKQTELVTEVSASKTFGTTSSVWPEWKTPVTITRTREYDPSLDDWFAFITIETETHSMKFTSLQWDKLEEFVMHSGTLMENV